jgi:glyoxylase-like metal-dependent hydrolase (beta-lactamase superfamily II)/ferredoxin
MIDFELLENTVCRSVFFVLLGPIGRQQKDLYMTIYLFHIPLLFVIFLIPWCRAWFLPTQYSLRFVDVTQMKAVPKRFSDNVEGILYVNDRCIDCSACSHYAPTVFQRTSHGHHVVHTQPVSETDIETARAAMAACPVAAIRVETPMSATNSSSPNHDLELARNLALSPKFNGRKLPFPRRLTNSVWYVGYHNEYSFGATPYLACVELKESSNIWIMIDSPRYCRSAVDAITSLTGPLGPNYLFLSHVDDTADHGKWKEEFPQMLRIFHSGDLGPNNWLGDSSLETVELLLGTNDHTLPSDGLNGFDLCGVTLSNDKVANAKENVVIYHTPGHSPGSISLYLKSDRILFTGDTLAFTQRTMTLTGFPRYGNDLCLQMMTLNRLKDIDWDLVAPGHGHVRDYSGRRDERNLAIDNATLELQDYVSRR